MYLEKNDYIIFTIFKNEVFRKILSNTPCLSKFSLFNLFVVFRWSAWRSLCWTLAHHDLGFCNRNKAKKKWQYKRKEMNNKIMFIAGFIIFVIYVYFLITIVRKQQRKKLLNPSDSFDTNDLDGIGNQGRFPSKN